MMSEKAEIELVVENTVAGWGEFAYAVLQYRKDVPEQIIARVEIHDRLDVDQLSTLQYCLLEFDRIERVLERQIDKMLIVSVSDKDDAYRILHYFWVIDRTREKFALQVLTPEGSVQEGEDDEWSVYLGRILPLICIGRLVRNRSVVDYNLFGHSVDTGRLLTQLSEALDKGKAPPIQKGEIISLIENYYMRRLISAFQEMSGTTVANLSPERKGAIQGQLKEIIFAQMPGLTLLARVLWSLSLWAMTESKDILLLRSGKEWELNEEAVQCSRMDAIAYAEGLQQLIENAYIHSEMQRSYLSIRTHRIGLSGGLQDIGDAVQSRIGLQRRIERLVHGGIESRPKADREYDVDNTVYHLDQDLKYVFEFQVVNDSISFTYGDGREWEPRSRGIAEMYLRNLNQWTSVGAYDFAQLFQGKFSGEESGSASAEHGNDPDYLAQHYGLRLLEKTVRLNGGYFYVSSPGWAQDVSVMDRYQSFGTDLRAEFPTLPAGRSERFTSYFILLPIKLHWTDSQLGKNTAPPQELFDRCALLEEPAQRLLRLRSPGGDSEEGLRCWFERADCLQDKSILSVVNHFYLRADPNWKMKVINSLCESLIEQLQGAGENDVCLLDLMQAQNYGLIELLAKMLFLNIAKGASGAENMGRRPVRFALLLPGKEHIWEFIRIFSIFYDKLENNSVMDRAQIAFCEYASAEDEKTDMIPEIAFLLAGGTAASAKVTARTFAYYNVGSTMEMIPLLHYLTRGAEKETTAHAVPQFPFDLFLTASTAREKNQCWFLRQMEHYLLSDLWKRPLGCRIHGIRVRLKSNIFLNDFYEAELLFHNIGVIYRFAYLIARDIFHQPQKGSRKLILIGYENYSTVLMEQITTLLSDTQVGFDAQYCIYSGKPEKPLHLSPSLQGMDQVARRSFLTGAQCLFVLPIGTTLSTLYDIFSAVKESNSFKDICFEYENYVLVLVGCEDNGTAPLSNWYWKCGDTAAVPPLPVQLRRQDANSPAIKARYFLMPRTTWAADYESGIDNFLKERVLVYVDQTSTIPRDIFVGEESRFRGVSQFVQGQQAQEENDRRIELLQSCIFYDHIVSGGNHFQFYLDVDRYYSKAEQPIKDAGAINPRRKTVTNWLRTLRNAVNPNAYNIIVSPLHQEDSPFAKAVVDQVFEHSLRFLHVDLTNVFREDIRAKFSYVAEEFWKIKKYDQNKEVNVYFVNTAITSGATLRRARNLLLMLLEESQMPYTREDVFMGCFVLVNRSGFDTLNSYVSQPEKNFHAYVHLAVPTLNSRKDHCPICDLVERYRTIEQRCSSKQLRDEFHRLAEKHERQNEAGYTERKKRAVLLQSGYANWLCQWLFTHVQKSRPAKTSQTVSVGIFRVKRDEAQRLYCLRSLMSWGLREYLAEQNITVDDLKLQQEEDYLAALNRFTLSDLQEIVKRFHTKALEVTNGDEECLSTDYWVWVVLDRVCAQKNYMRLYATHRTFLAMEELADSRPIRTGEGGDGQQEQYLADLPLDERGFYTAEVLLNVIMRAIDGDMKKELKAEWLISYLKVMSRPHLAQYHHIRQAILYILLQLVDDAIWDGKSPTGHGTLKMNNLYDYLMTDNPFHLTPLMQYQILQTALKRLAGVQSTYFLHRKNMHRILCKIQALRDRYFAELANELTLTPQDRPLSGMFNPFIPQREIEIGIVKLVKWASSYGDDENGCYLIEEQFKEEGFPWR